MTVEIETVVTDYDWCETRRPRLVIAENKKHCWLEVGRDESTPRLEVFAISVNDLKCQLEGLVEIFQAAVNIVSQHLGNTDSGCTRSTFESRVGKCEPVDGRDP